MEELLDRGSHDFFRKHSSHLSAHPLYPYLQAAYLRSRLPLTNKDETLAFLANHAPAPYGENLRNALLRQLATDRQWQLFHLHYVEPRQYDGAILSCLQASALLNTGRHARLPELVSSLWMVGSSQPSECDETFSWGIKTGVIDEKMIWERLMLVADNSNYKLAKYLAKKLKRGNRIWFKRLKSALSYPQKTLTRPANICSQSFFSRGTTAAALKRLARSDPVAATGVWQKMKQSDCGDRHQAGIALAFALSKQLYSRRSYLVFASVPARERDNGVYKEMIRVSLRTGNWRQVLENIEFLTTSERQEAEWQYWKAVALASRNDKKKADAIFNRLADGSGYFNFLAADRARKNYSWRQTASVDAEAKQVVLHWDAAQRMRALLELGRFAAARRELHFFLASLDKSEKRVLLTLCDHWQWSYCSVKAAAAFLNGGEYYLGHPLPYGEIVRKAAKESDVPVALLYAVMRSESAFMENIASHSGALGLMQLMPRTAKASAKLIGVKLAGKRDILSADPNIRLGASHLARLNKTFNEATVCIAAYNAGSGRVKKWLKLHPLGNPAVWVAGLPFKETREYVRRVFFSYLVIRRILMQPSVRLSALMRQPLLKLARP